MVSAHIHLAIPDARFAIQIERPRPVYVYAGANALRTDGKWIDFSKFRSSPDVRNAAVELVTPEEGLALLSAIAKDLPSFKSKLESALKEVLPE